MQNPTQINQNQIKIQQALPNAKSLECECGGVLFRQVMVLKEINKILIGSPQNLIIPIEVHRCDDCGAVLESLLPKDINIFNEDGDKEEILRELDETEEPETKSRLIL